MVELKSYLQLRSNIYLLLASLFYKEATQAYFAEVQKHLEVFEELAKLHENSTLQEGVAKYREFYNSVSDWSKMQKDMAGAFSLIFLGVGLSEGIKGIVPQESVYMSGLIMREEFDEVLEVYYEHKAGKQDDFTEPEDHLSAELGFMAYMSQKAAVGERGTFQKNIEAQLSFLTKHIMSFSSSVCADLAKFEYPYYESMATLVNGFLEIDAKFLSELHSEHVTATV